MFLRSRVSTGVPAIPPKFWRHVGNGDDRPVVVAAAAAIWLVALAAVLAGACWSTNYRGRRLTVTDS